MSTDLNKTTLPARPKIEDFDEPVAFVEAMLAHRKKTERGFSILRATSSLRRISPALVSLVIARKRSLTADRAEEFSKLLALTPAERHFFKAWIGEKAMPIETSSAAIAAPLKPPSNAPLRKIKVRVEQRNRKDVSQHILNDWLNCYVKDLFMFSDVQKNPALAEKRLLHIASPKRVRTSIDFLLREGHLRRTLDGSIVVETQLAVVDQKIPSKKIRAFHKAALGIAQKAIDRVDPCERMAATLLISLNAKSYKELIDLIEDFNEKLKDLGSAHLGDGTALYQLVINASPVGGSLK